MLLFIYPEKCVKTYSAKPADVEKKWYLVDAAGQTLGRLASNIAIHLRGKHKPQYTPHIDTGDYIVVINAEKVKVTGNKRNDKIYYRHSGYIGNLKKASFAEMLAKHPERTIRIAVKGMLPHNPLGRRMLRKLRVYAGDSNQHQAQKPERLEI